MELRARRQEQVLSCCCIQNAVMQGAPRADNARRPSLKLQITLSECDRRTSYPA